MRRKGHSWLGFLTCLLVLAACGEDGVEANPSVAPFVGTWDATVYQIWPESNPSFVTDVLTQFGPFYITVEPSGQYTAVLQASPTPQVQIGQLSVLGTSLRLDVTTPAGQPSVTATYGFQAADNLVLDGPVEIDFNNDGTRDPGGSHIELQRRP